jgi:cytochrome oxidase Cu insertion factor (SCO1/SenC/PrrC family)
MRQTDGIQKLARAALIATSALVIIAAIIWGIQRLAASRSITQAAAPQPNPSNIAIGGFPMSGNPAPDFQLTDQFGKPFRLSSLRGHEVVLAFIDARCTTLCPLTAQIMYYAKTQLDAAAASQIDLVAVNANPTATSVTAVQSWSIQHGMLHQWEFVTGTPQQLNAVYHLYNVYVQVSSNNAVEHDPITFIIDATGHERLYYETLDSNAQADIKSQEIGLEDGMKQWLPK